MYQEIKYLNKLILDLINELNTNDINILLNNNQIFNYLENIFKERDFIYKKELEICNEVTKNIIYIYIKDKNIKIIDEEIKCFSNYSNGYYMYINDINKYKFFSKEKERELLLDYRNNNNQKSKDLLVLSYQRLIIKIAKRLTDDQHILLDLIQVGNISLINCIDNYDLKFDCKLSSYAYPYILSTIDRYYDKYKYLNVYGYEYVYYKRVIDKYKNEYFIINGEYPSNEKIINKFNITYKMLEKINKVHIIDSLDSFCLLEENEMIDNELEQKMNLITSHNVIEHNVEVKDIYNNTIRVLEDILTPLELKVIKGVYGIDGNVKKQSEIAEEFNVTRQNISIAYKNALKKIEKSNKIKKLKRIYNS